MANLNDNFLQFNNLITISSSKSDNLKKSRDALRKDIKNWFTDNEKKQPSFCWQGSYAMKTLINPINGKEYDLDDGVYLLNYSDVDENEWPSTYTVHNWIKDAVKDRTKQDPIDKNTCIRVKYSAGYHIDLPIYIYSNENVYLAHKKDGWIKSDPKSFRKWFIDYVNKEDYGEQLRRIVKYLKAWVNYNDFDIKGIELTILATNNFEKYDNRDDKCLRNTLDNIISSLENNFKCEKPVEPYENLFLRLGEEKDTIVSHFKSFHKVLEKCINDTNERNASLEMINILGSRFPESEEKNSNNNSKNGVMNHDGRSA